MAYVQQMAQINSEMVQSNTGWGFPTGTFTKLLLSYWMCGPYAASPPASAGSPGIFLQATSPRFFNWGPQTSGVAGDPFICLTNVDVWTSGTPFEVFFKGNIPVPLPTDPLGCSLHMMMSVDCTTQMVQVYINDQAIAIPDATWSHPGMQYFKIDPLVNIWDWLPYHTTLTGRFPAIGDVWISHTPDFVDLSVTANRRKFISSDMTPVDLGDDGSLPLGFQPALYMSVREGGAPADILNNLGVGGGSWNPLGAAPGEQTSGVCSAIPVPAPLPMRTLRIDDLTVISPATPGVNADMAVGNRIWLSWSDDRGHSYGSPVMQEFGPRGRYIQSLQWQRLGYARDRVFVIEWSSPQATALQGAWIDVQSEK